MEVEGRAVITTICKYSFNKFIKYTQGEGS